VSHHNQHSETLATMQYIAKAVSVIGFVWGAGFAFQASEITVGCISLLMAWLAPSILGESYE